MAEVRQTDLFKKWFAALRDVNAKRRITQRIVRLQSGLMGDVKPVGDGVSELRVDYGPGYRLYFVTRGAEVVILVCGGDKQTQDATSGARNLWRRSFKAAAAAFNLTEDATMKLKTTPFDPADFLDTRESQIELLADAIDSGDSRYIANALGTIARARGMAKVAKETGLTRQALYRSLSKTGDPRLTTLLRVAKSLGLKLSFETT
jgi:putative addiction module killer protein/probable addiction module antidote protein